MGKIIIYTCDRCYKNIDNIYAGGILTSREGGRDDKTIYLCQSCQNDFLKFMENKKDK